MAFCVKCGAYIAEGSNTCPACGKKVGEPEKKKTKTSGSSSGSAGAAAQAKQESQKTQQQSKTRKNTQSSERPRQENRSGSAKTDTSGTYTYNNENTQAGNGSANTSANTSGEYHYSYKNNYNDNAGQYGNDVWEDTKKAWEDTKKTWGGVKRKWTHKVKSEYKNNYKNNYNNNYNSGRRGVNGVYSVSDQESRPMIAILSYFGLLFLVPYILRNDSEFVRFHANQGLLLFLCGAASGVVASMPILGWLCGLVGTVFTVVCFFQGINNVIKGRYRELPIIGKIQLLK